VKIEEITISYDFKKITNLFYVAYYDFSQERIKFKDRLMSWSEFTILQLKDVLKEMGLSISGNNELITKLLKVDLRGSRLTEIRS